MGLLIPELPRQSTKFRIVPAGDGRPTVEDLETLTRADAVRILRKRYFGPRTNLLPEPLQPSVFDMQVNQSQVGTTVTDYQSLDAEVSG